MNYSEHLKKQISSNPISEIAFDELKETYESCLSGKSKASFYVAPIDAGFGKSISYKAFLAEKEAEGFKECESVLIVYRTKNEVKNFIEKFPPVSPKDIALFTSEEPINKLGAFDRNYARVLVTTHQMVKGRLDKKPFNSAEEFFYKGKPRSLRIWDEAIAPAQTIHIGMDELVTLHGPLRHACGGWVAELERFEKLVAEKGEGAVLTIPKTLQTGIDRERAEPLLTTAQVEIFGKLRRAAGKKVRVVTNSRELVLVGVGAALPADLAPLIILDASARVNPTYPLWESERGGLKILPSATRNYEKLTVYIGKQGCGKTALRNPKTREAVLRPIANIINTRPDERWLVIGPKDTLGLPVPAEIEGSALKPENVDYLHWGLHFGTNEFRDFKNIIVIGAFPAPETSYFADYATATGIDLEKLTDEHRKVMKAGKLKDNLLQAICRGNVRNGEADVCGKCNAYLMMPASQNPEALVREIFPGCKIAEWLSKKPNPTKVTHEEKVFAILKVMKDSGRVAPVSKAEVRVEAGIGNPTQLSTLLTNGLTDRLSRIGVDTMFRNFTFNEKMVSLPGGTAEPSDEPESDLARIAS